MSVPVNVGAGTKYIISTSGRTSSLLRYKVLLQDLLHLDFAYIAINSGDPSKPKISPERFAWALKGMPCIGGAISRDIKNAIIPYLDYVDSEALQIQSVNTVLVRDGKLYGYNTDAMGFRAAIVNGIAGREVKSAVCYGYGGVVSVVVTVLRTLGIKQIYICGRNLEEASRRANELGVSLWTPNVTDIELFVNAAPVTDMPLSNAINLLDCIKTCKIAFDHEMPGKFLQEFCQENGIHYISGLDMYYPQMLGQWKLFLEEFNFSDEKLTALLREADAVANK